MRVIFDHDRCTLLHGDSAQLGAVLPEACVDALVTDPPAGIGFMAKGWDRDKGGRDAWIAWLAQTLAPSFRAMRPGAHGLVWALPRTSHWTALALELVGFEIRDRVSHLFGTGFPKSLDVSKAIDGHLGAERRVIGERPGTGSTTFAGETDGKGLGPTVQITEPASAQAAAWEGWGTALKPAMEDWWLVRKPLVGTVAENVLRYGTGGLNIDGCRIGDSGGTSKAGMQISTYDTVTSYGNGLNSTRFGIPVDGLGRWPAHLTLSHERSCWVAGPDDYLCPICGEVRKSGECSRCGTSRGRCAPGCPVAQMDAQSGAAPAKPRREGQRDKINPLPGVWPADPGGGASRFFYVAKGSRSEKDEGLGHLPASTGGAATGREDGAAGLGNPRAGAGRTGGARNVHPTVKSLALMRWLCRLITPPGGVVLDPFAGSGSTGVAALAEGFRFVGCEQGGGEGDPYLPILIGRIRNALGA